MHVAVIGGGAAGMMAAITAAGAGASVSLIESGSVLGKKILSTGNGRCNLTNLSLDTALYQGSFRRHASVLLREFSVQDTIDFFESIGIPTVVAGSARGNDNWVYPACKEAAALRMALDMECERLGVERILDTKVTGLDKQDGVFLVMSESTKVLEADKVILTTGGKAFPKSGSDGSGYALAQSFGHGLVTPLPALGALISDHPGCKNLAGVRVEAQLSLLVEGNITAQEYGEIQFTEYGLSGIPVFQMSGRAVRELLAEHQVHMSLDLNPEHTEEEVFLDLVERKLRREKRESGTLLLGLVPSKMVPVLFKLCDIPLHIPCEEIAKDKLLNLAHQLKHLDFEIIDARDFDACQVTSGGIPATEVSLALESIKVRGLYFAGEILDLDGPCGGYNLQWAWSSAHAAGLAAAKEE